jgi:hypothetical protein
LEPGIDRIGEFGRDVEDEDVERGQTDRINYSKPTI